MQSEFGELAEIWNFSAVFARVLGVPAFSLEDLHCGIHNTRADCPIVPRLVQAFISVLLNDVQEMAEKDPQSAFILELSGHLADFPLESALLLLSLKRYKKCVGFAMLDALSHCIRPGPAAPWPGNLTAQERKDLLLSLSQAAMVTVSVRNHVNEQRQNMKILQSLEKSKYALQREIRLFEDVERQAAAEGVEITEEKRGKLRDKREELAQTEERIRGLGAVRTEKLGTDVDEKEYWTFAGDTRRVYLREIEEVAGRFINESWGIYSGRTKIEELMRSLCEQGVMERKLKLRLAHALSYMDLSPAADSRFSLSFPLMHSLDRLARAKVESSRARRGRSRWRALRRVCWPARNDVCSSSSRVRSCGPTAST